MIRFLSWTFIAWTFLFVDAGAMGQTFSGDTGSIEEALGACKGGPAAFPGARGYGQCAVGWRNGRIVRVTNTNDSGAGSFRDECVEATGPRVCIFDVGGTITNQTPLQAFEGNVYIAGQSAPEDSGGIQIKLDTDGPNNAALNFSQSDHVLIRHIRIRPGPGDLGAIGDSISGLLFRNVRWGMVANVSVAYASDQNITTNADAFNGLAPIRGKTRYLTFQNNISAYGLSNANHSNGSHSKAALHCASNLGDLQNGDRCDHLSIIEDLYATSKDRMPELSAGSGGPYHISGVLTYNASSNFFEVDADNYPGMVIDITNSRAKEGPDTRDTDPPNLFECRDDLGTGVAKCNVYAHNNIADDYRPTVQSGTDASVLDDTDTLEIELTPYERRLGGSMLNPERLEEDLLPLVGATKPVRDALDTLIVEQVVNRTGTVPDLPGDIVGAGLTDGYPTLATGTPHNDADNDGMPDEWELAMDGHSFFVNVFNAWGDRDGDGWKNLEEYLNFRAGDIPDPRP